MYLRLPLTPRQTRLCKPPGRASLAKAKGSEMDMSFSKNPRTINTIEDPHYPPIIPSSPKNLLGPPVSPNGWYPGDPAQQQESPSHYEQQGDTEFASTKNKVSHLDSTHPRRLNTTPLRHLQGLQSVDIQDSIEEILRNTHLPMKSCTVRCLKT